MNNSLKASVVAIVATLGLSSSAQAGIFDFDPAEGSFFASGFGGIAIPSDADFEGVQAPVGDVPGVAGDPANVEASFDNSFYYGGSVGARLPFKYWTYFQPRVELEISRFDSGDVNGGSFNGGTQTFSGSQSATFYLITNNSDIIWSEDQRIVPYFGGGLGIADYDATIDYFPNNGVATSPTFQATNTGSAFTTVSTLGATLKTNSRFDIFVEGRYLKTYGLDAERRFVADDGFSASLDDDPDGFTFTGGIRLNF